MRKTVLYWAAIAGLAACFASGAAAQDTDKNLPQVENAQVEKRALNGSLAAEVKKWMEQTDRAQWLGYAVPQIGGERTLCCGDSDGSWRNGCGHCTLDAGNLTLTWLSGVKPSESVEMLQTFVRGADLDSGEAQHMAHAALTAIAMHADPAADRALASFTQAEQPASLRRQTAFWLGAAREKAGLAALQKMAKTDPSSEVRAQVAFALSVSHEPGAVEEMIRMAHEDESSHVRGQALFWLAHKAGQKAVGAITGAIENDPDTDVKKK